MRVIDGIPVETVRKSLRRISIRIRRDGQVVLSIPRFGATLAEGESFLRARWPWVVRTRARVLARPPLAVIPVTPEERSRLVVLLNELVAAAAARAAETTFTWKVRTMKSLWGSCQTRKRVLTFNTELARVPRELVEYVVIHEFAHFRVPNHGPHFQALMDVRLPGWRLLRRRLNARDFVKKENETSGSIDDSETEKSV